MDSKKCEIILDRSYQLQPDNKNCSQNILQKRNIGYYHSGIPLTKRRRSDSDVAKHRMSPNSSTSAGATNCGYDGGIPNFAVHCPASTNLEESPSKWKKKELRTLKMQIAMISDADGDRPIHVAVVQENLLLLRKLCAVMLKTAISLDLTNYLRQTPLHLAVMLGNTEIVKLLLKCGSSVTLRDRNGNSIIHLAVKSNSKKEILCLILSHPQCNTILNLLDYEGYTALHYAVMRNNKTAVTCLHRSNADMNVMDGKSGRSALIYAIMDQNNDMVEHLLECDVNINVTDYSGRSALDLALQASNEDIIRMLERKSLSEEISNPMQNSDKLNQNITSKRTKQFRTE